MGYIEGQSLSKKTKVAMPEHRLPQREVYEYLMQVLSALEVVHDKNLFHLDLKPGNVMVDNEGKAMLIDFGASKQTNPDGGEATRTALCYTPGYAPIEQMEQDLDNIGPWTDLYSMGATLFFALTGKTPPKPIKLIQEGEEALKFPDDIVPGMRQLVVKLMKPNRQDRFQSVDEVRQWIQKNIKKPEKLPDVVIRPDDEEETEVIVIRPDKEIKERLEKEKREKEERARKEQEEKERTEKERREREKKEKERIEKEERERKELEERAREKREKKEYENPVSPASPLFLSKLPLKKTAIIAGCAFIAILLGVLGLKTCGSAPEEKTPAVTAAPQTESPEAITVENMKASNTLGDYLYTGMIDADSLPHGKGEAVFSNSATAKSYKGSFVHGVMDGSDAEYVFQNGDAFIGSFKDGHFDEGKLTIAQTGEYYVGKFNVDGVPPTDADGNPTDGKWYDKDGNEL
jgi:serine/threonine protein kinase